MSRIQTDLTGMKFGSLTVLERAPYKDNRPAWSCVCDCGRVVDVQSKRLLGKKNNRAISCGCSRANKILPGVTWGNAYEVLVDYMTGAKRRGYVWRLTDIQAMTLFAGDCHYCGTKPSTIRTKQKGEPFIYNGIDRLDPHIGYVTENCVSCCAPCNYFKLGRHVDDFLATVKAIYEHTTKK